MRQPAAGMTMQDCSWQGCSRMRKMIGKMTLKVFNSRKPAAKAYMQFRNRPG
jgi:hypothetical protein